MLVNTDNDIILSKNGLISTIAWKIKDKVQYAIEGSVFVGCAVIQWLRDSLNIIETADESEQCAYNVKSTRDIYFVPAFVGLGAPYWDDEARGTILGLTRAVNRNHIVRAALESVAYQTKDVVEVIKKESKIDMNCFKVDGGGTANNYLMQFQADILKTEIILPKFLETTALGAAYLSGLYVGFYKSINDISKIHKIKQIFYPKMDDKTIATLYSGWKLAVKSARTFKYKVN